MGLARAAKTVALGQAAAVSSADTQPEVTRSITARKQLIADALNVLKSLRIPMSARTPSGFTAAHAVATDSAASSFTQSDEEYWVSNEGLTSERQFHNKLYYQLNLLGAAYRQYDLDAMCDCIRRILWVEHRADDEPLQSIYESGLVLSLLVIARACSDHYLIEQAYTVTERCQYVLIAKNERRLAQEQPPRPDSECWYTLYSIIAELKWKGGRDYRERILNPQQLIVEFEGVEKRCLDFLARNPCSDTSRNKRVREALGWCRLQIIKMSLLWCRQNTTKLIERFNELHGSVLSPEVAGFECNSGGDRNSPWYWDLELFKWCALGPALQDEAYLCHQWRLDTMRAGRAHNPELEAFRRASEREVKALLERAGAPEVPHAC